jgi:putative membrane protein (TIGR04086 family)
MKNNRFFGGRKLSVLSSTALSACVGCGAIFVAVLAFAYVITKIDATDLMLSVMSTAALGIGAYAGGYVCGKRQRRNGLLSGVLCGVFIFLIIVILSALFSKAAESFSVPAKLVLTLVCAGVGGVVAAVFDKDKYLYCINYSFIKHSEICGIISVNQLLEVKSYETYQDDQ